MDLEVTRAYRTLQRAGISVSPISPQMDLKEFQANYGVLLKHWLEHHGLHCGLLPLSKLKYSNYGHIAETVLIRAAQPYLEKLFEEKNQRPPSNLRVRTIARLGNGRGFEVDPSNPLESMFAGFATQFSPYQLWNQFFNPHGFFASNGSLLAGAKKGETAALLFCVAQDELQDVHPEVYVILCGYREVAPEETAKTRVRKEKADQAAAKRKATLEAKEKALLEKLKAKYDSNG